MQDLQKKPLPTYSQQQNSPKPELKPQSPIQNSPYKPQSPVQNSPYKSQSPAISPYKVTPKKPTPSPPRFVAQKNIETKGISGTEIKSERGIFTVRSGNQQIVVGVDIVISILINDQQEGFPLFLIHRKLFIFP